MHGMRYGKKRSAATNKGFPGRSRRAEVGGSYPKGPSTRPAVAMGKKPKKGVLMSGGGHG